MYIYTYTYTYIYMYICIYVCICTYGVSGVTLSGVRISCDMVARNCDFASFAA